MEVSGSGLARITKYGLFADVRGPASAPAVLFLHGGPGQGCHDFMAFQAGPLARSARVIGLDQRGVGCSAPLPESATVTMADLVDDCERVREELNIPRWAVLGQSFGGMLALRYAVAYPAAVTAVIFENPVWDMAATCRAVLPRLAGLLSERGKEHQARAAREAASGEASARALRVAYVAALAALGEDREAFFVPHQRTQERLREIRLVRLAGQPPPDEDSMIRHHQAIVGSDAFHESVLPLLSRLRVPALLITGGHDPLTSEEQRGAFRLASPANQWREFPDAGHFVHADEPDGYAQAVSGFLYAQGTARTRRVTGAGGPSATR